jgi:segregation and condensation protein B
MDADEEEVVVDEEQGADEEEVVVDEEQGADEEEVVVDEEQEEERDAEEQAEDECADEQEEGADEQEEPDESDAHEEDADEQEEDADEQEEEQEEEEQEREEEEQEQEEEEEEEEEDEQEEDDASVGDADDGVEQREKSKPLGDDVDYGDEEEDAPPTASRKGNAATEMRRGMKVFPAICTAIRIAAYRGFIVQSVFGEDVPSSRDEWSHIRTHVDAVRQLMNNSADALRVLHAYKARERMTEAALKSTDHVHTPFIVAVACPLIEHATERMICHVHEAPSEAHMIVFLSAQDKGLNVANMKKVRDFLARTPINVETVAILAMSEPTSPSAKKELTNPPTPIELLLIPKMQCFIPEHFLTPPHTPLTKKDVQIVLQKTYTKEFQLPIIDKHDPIAVFLGLRPGDAVLFQRIVNGQRSHDYIRRVATDADESEKYARDDAFLKRAS